MDVGMLPGFLAAAPILTQRCVSKRRRTLPRSLATLDDNEPPFSPKSSRGRKEIAP